MFLFPDWRQASSPESHCPVQRCTKREKTKLVLGKLMLDVHEAWKATKRSAHWSVFFFIFLCAPKWEEFMALGRDEPDAPLDAVISQQKPNQCCTLIYTSGTTGQPKGVMLSHDNVSFKFFFLQSTKRHMLCAWRWQQRCCNEEESADWWATRR